MLANLPQVQSRTYFGLANLEARWIAAGGASTSRECPRPRTEGYRRTVATQDIDLAAQTSGDPFPAFDPHKEIVVGSFVAMYSPKPKRKNGAAFYVGNVHALNCVANAEGMMHVIWYWPKMPRGSIDAPGKWHQQYLNCVQRAWVPSREPDDWVSVSSAMTSWENTMSTLMFTVHGLQVEKEIKIPRGEVHHILLHASAEAQIIDDKNKRSI